MTKVYDFVVIGGGSAGCAVAARLSEMPDCEVLLLEAGPGDRHMFLDMPLAFRLLRMTNLFDWGLATEPEPYANNRSIPAARGRVLGGSSSVNGMMYSRGHPRDYDTWAQLGAKGWSFDDVLPFFRKSEAHWRGSSEWHGGDGPMSVSSLDRQDPLTQAMMETGRRAGYPVSPDFEGEIPEGFGLPDITTYKGKRASASRAFLRPARKRPNLTVITSAHVSKLDIKHDRVTQVHYLKNGKACIASVGSEAILCGGAYASPHLLMLSGIGPADHIRQTGIDPVLDLPGVGQNLKEHPLVAMGFNVRKPLGFNQNLRADRLGFAGLNWLLTGKGFAATVPLTAILYHRSRAELERPDLENIVMPTALDAKVWFPGLIRPRDEMLTNLCVGLQPRSTGEVALKSSDPFTPPAIRFNILQEQEDVDALKQNIRWSRDLVRQDPLAEFVGEEAFPGANVSDDSDLEAYIRATVVTAQHPACTCRMGTDERAVVDPDLKVHGMSNLRVADASIMPTLIGGHTNAPAIMIGERAAQFIKNQYTS